MKIKMLGKRRLTFKDINVIKRFKCHKEYDDKLNEFLLEFENLTKENLKLKEEVEKLKQRNIFYRLFRRFKNV